jgi:hypothetical protein
MVWYTEDPLIPQKLLHVDAVEESPVNEEVALMRNHDKSKDEGMEDISHKFRPLEGKIIDLLGSNAGKVLIRNVEANGVKRNLTAEDDIRITLEIGSAENARLSMSGKFKRELLPPDLTFEDAWLAALGPRAELWDRSRNPPALRSTFDELTTQELASFRKTTQLEAPEIPRYGAFENTSVDDVPIIPRRQIDANRWANWLLNNSIDSYMVGKRYERALESCKSKFPDYDIQLPSIEKLVSEINDRRTSDGRLPKEYWYLKAPLDLRMAEA